MSLVRMGIQTIVVGAGQMAGSLSSLLILRSNEGDSSFQLPIRIGTVESTAISYGINGRAQERPLTHDLLVSTIEALDARVYQVIIYKVEGTTFFSHILLERSDGDYVSIESRPSDAIALAVRVRAPIFATQEVLDTAALPNFKAVENALEKDTAAFHDFIEGLSPEDFAMGQDPEGKE